MTTKQKRTAILIITLLSVFSLTIYSNLKSFHAKFFNKTGENIDSLMIGKSLIGQLEKDESTEYIDFKSFEFDGSFPYEDVRGVIKNRKLEPFYWSECGTGMNSKSNGSYKFDIRKGINEKGETVLFLAHHNQKMFWE
jgi:hypothetical protein